MNNLYTVQTIDDAPNQCEIIKMLQLTQKTPSFRHGQIFAPAISAFPTSLWVMPESRAMDGDYPWHPYPV
jgi:hypothetical protein